MYYSVKATYIHELPFDKKRNYKKIFSAKWSGICYISGEILDFFKI
jgi:hypothetical protein